MKNIISVMRKKNVPPLYATEHIPADDKKKFLHFFIADYHWFVAEFDGEDSCFGYAILNGDVRNAEWGYFSLQELQSVKVIGLRVKYDPFWQSCIFREVRGNYVPRA